MIRKERAGVFREHSVQFDTHGLVPQHLRDIDRESETAPPFAEQAWLQGGKSFSRQLVVARNEVKAVHMVHSASNYQHFW